MESTKWPTPGKLTAEEAVSLSNFCEDKTVLQLGAYCGKASAVIGKVCRSLLVIEDYQGYPVSQKVCMQEFMYACREYDAKIDLKQKQPEDLSPDEVGKYEVVYIDADRRGSLEDDKVMGLSLLDEEGWLFYHTPDGKLEHCKIVGLDRHPMMFVGTGEKNG